MNEIIKKYGYVELNNNHDYIRQQGGLIVRIRTLELKKGAFHPRIYVWLSNKIHGHLDDLCFDVKAPADENAVKDALNRINTYASLFV